MSQTKNKRTSKRDSSIKPSATATKGKPRSVPEPPVAAPQTTEGLDGAMRALTLALDKKAVEPVLLDVRGRCSYCNYQLVVSGRSDRQVDAITEGITTGLKLDGVRPVGAEPARTGQWSLIDYGDFLVHVMLHSAREHFDLEGLWHDAPRIPIDVPPDARLPVGEAYDAAR
jgi:ribosome-associated protein